MFNDRGGNTAVCAEERAGWFIKCKGKRWPQPCVIAIQEACYFMRVPLRWLSGGKWRVRLGVYSQLEKDRVLVAVEGESSLVE